MTLEWIARHILALGEDVRVIREDLDRLIVVVRSIRSEADVTGVILVRVERRLERLEEERQP